MLCGSKHIKAKLNPARAGLKLGLSLAIHGDGQVEGGGVKEVGFKTEFNVEKYKRQSGAELGQAQYKIG